MFSCQWKAVGDAVNQAVNQRVRGPELYTGREPELDCLCEGLIVGREDRVFRLLLYLGNRHFA
jgi:hypothetical protein